MQGGNEMQGKYNNIYIPTANLNEDQLRGFTPNSLDQENTLTQAYISLKNKPAQGGIWTTKHEISTSFMKRVISVPGRKPATHVNCYIHEAYAKKYNSANMSCMGTVHDWFLFLLYLNLEKGISLNKLFVDSSSLITPHSELQLTGENIIGETISNAVGNTSKIVRYADENGEVIEGKYCLVSTSYQDALWRPMSLGYVYHIAFPQYQRIPSVPFVTWKSSETAKNRKKG